MSQAQKLVVISVTLLIRLEADPLAWILSTKISCQKGSFSS